MTITVKIRAMVKDSKVGVRLAWLTHDGPGTTWLMTVISGCRIPVRGAAANWRLVSCGCDLSFVEDIHTLCLRHTTRFGDVGRQTA